MQKKYKILIFWLIVFIILIYLPAMLISWSGYRFNSTISMPKGIYKLEKTVDIERGDIVEICLPDNIANEGIQKGYIHNGSCSNGSIPLAKKVLALPGDYVVMNETGITVNGQFYDYPQQFFDGFGHKIIPKDINGKIDGFIVVGVGHKLSWDSRYYGEIPKNSIKGILMPIWTY
uniref:Conjugal transfer signal peptidase TraF n=1 Tax=Francisella tularensis subsp. novicida PA10-7858 TaxID=1386968 RepID=V5T989_FRANO|nr:conjugative transfer signal peptidase TraF [Francisella tularensis]AHB60782.1 Conjugal transfer signal peptidase TraF [Francisella tularensis subsp. novicida PA10-7858]